MRMIGKLGEDKKADWPGPLAEIVHTYNATQSTVTGYSPHYLMFGRRPRLPVDFYFPTFRSTEAPMRGASAKHMDMKMWQVSATNSGPPSRSSDPVNSRSPKTEMVLQPKDRCHGPEAWQSGLSEG